MSIFSKKCEYCRVKIEKGKEVKKDVKVLGYVGTHPKHFCCEEHGEKYVEEINNRPQQKSGGGCCG